MSRYIVGISGASGAPYVRRVLQVLANSEHQLDLVVTQSGAKVLEVEEGVKLTGNVASDLEELSRWIGYDMSDRDSFQWHDSTNVAADITPTPNGRSRRLPYINVANSRSHKPILPARPIHFPRSLSGPM